MKLLVKKKAPNPATWTLVPSPSYAIIFCRSDCSVSNNGKCVIDYGYSSINSSILHAALWRFEFFRNKAKGCSSKAHKKASKNQSEEFYLRQQEKKHQDTVANVASTSGSERISERKTKDVQPARGIIKIAPPEADSSVFFVLLLWAPQESVHKSIIVSGSSGLCRGLCLLSKIRWTSHSADGCRFFNPLPSVVLLRFVVALSGTASEG